MKVERWNPKKHLPQLGAWHRAHGTAPHAGDARLYPSTGFVVDSCVVGFLFTTNAPHTAFIDHFSTNPSASTRRIHAALTRLIAELVNEAKTLGIQWVKGATAQPGIVRIALRQGFRNTGADQTGLVQVMKE